MVTPLGVRVIIPRSMMNDEDVTVRERTERLEFYKHGIVTRIHENCIHFAEFCDRWEGYGLYKDFAADWPTFCTEVLACPIGWVQSMRDGVKILQSQGHAGAIPAALAVSTAQKAQALAASPDLPALQEHGGERKKDIQAYDVSLKHGNRSTYLIRRLKRDHPLIAAALARGAYPSARAAAKAAGIPVAATTTIRTDDAQKALQTLLRFYTPATLLAALTLHQKGTTHD